MPFPISIFISYAREDQKKAERLRKDLVKRYFDAWKDTNELLPGEKFEQRIISAMEKAHCVALCLSETAVSKTGFIQFEIKHAVRLQKLRPDNKIFIIPVRFELCNLPADLQEIQYVDLFPDWKEGLDKIEASIWRHFPLNERLRQLRDIAIFRTEVERRKRIRNSAKRERLRKEIEDFQAEVKLRKVKGA